MMMSHAARLTLLVLALVVVLFFATGAYADGFSITFTGSPVPSGAYAGDSVSGTLDVVASPDGLGDGGFLASSITDGTLTFTVGGTSTPYTEDGLVPLDPSSPSPSDPSNSAFYICDTPTCYHYWGYDNLLYPGTPDLSDGLLFYLTGVTEPVELFCSSSGTCDVGVWLNGADNGNDPYDAGFEYLPVTMQEQDNSVPEPSTLLLLTSGLGLLTLAGVARRIRLPRSADLA
jgi:hypothetical protein